MLTVLMTITLPIKTIQWGAPSDFSQRNIAVEFKNSKDHVKGLNRVVEFVEDDDTHFARDFTGSKEESFHLVTALERNLDEAFLDVGVIHVHGGLRPPQEYIIVRIFCLKLALSAISARILLATSAANVGIDNNLVLFIFSLSWPRNLCTYFQ